MDAPEIQRVIDGLQTGILVTDDCLKVIYANDFELEYYGLERDELVGRDIMTRCHTPKSRIVINEMVQRMRAGRVEEQAKFAVGQLIRYKALRDDEGRFAGVVRTRMWLPEGVDEAALPSGRSQSSE